MVGADAAAGDHDCLGRQLEAAHDLAPGQRRAAHRGGPGLDLEAQDAYYERAKRDLSLQ